jgi:hypothetical protein
MTVSLYAITVPVFTRLLTNLSGILDKTEAWAADRRIDTAVLAASRLAPDMFPLTRQIQFATDYSKFAVARLAGQQPPSWPDEEKTFPELKSRIHKALDFQATFTPEMLDGREDLDVTMTVGGKPVQAHGMTYLLNRALPNFYFHYTTAYAILRHNGVPVGKADYIG